MLTYQNIPNEIHRIGQYISATCIPYSESACRIAAEKAGFKLGGGGSDFAVHNKIGCYAYTKGTKYKGSAYYGRGGDRTSISEPLDIFKDYHRPEGYDCSHGNLVKNNFKHISIRVSI